MAVPRMKRVNELIKREIGQSLFRVTGEDRPAASRATVTRVETAPNLREARVFVSVLGDADTQQDVLRVLRRHRIDFQKAVSENITLKYTPRLRFDLDASIEKGHKVLALLKELEDEEGASSAESGEDDGEET